jgi:hypothetical protein
VLLYGVAGALGQIMAPWAKALGAFVIGVVSKEASIARVKAAGCDAVLVLGECDLDPEATRGTLDQPEAEARLESRYSAQPAGGLRRRRSRAPTRRYRRIVHRGLHRPSPHRPLRRPPDAGSGRWRIAGRSSELRLHSTPQAVQDGGRIAWGSGPAGEPPRYTGLDVIIVRDGKIVVLYVFLDSLPV